MENKFPLAAATAVLCACAFAGEKPFAIDRSVVSDAYWRIWNDAEQAAIDAAIERNRKADATVALGVPDGTEVSVEQREHAFRFGAHIFNFNQLGKGEWNAAYKASYGPGGLFNQATVAFYWCNFEPIPGARRAFGAYEDTEAYWNALSLEAAAKDPYWRRPAPGPVIDYLKKRGVAVHGHILVWGSAKPEWIYDWYCPDDEKAKLEAIGIPHHADFMKPGRAGVESQNEFGRAWKRAWEDVFARYDEDELAAVAPTFAKNMREVFRTRVTEVARLFGRFVGSWDVVNESSHDWAIDGRARTGRAFCNSHTYALMPGDYPLHALLDAKAAFPATAKLAINDYNIAPAFLAQVNDLAREGARIDLVGCQMHIFNTNDCARLAAGATDVNWVGTPKTIRDRLDMMAKTGRPIHVSEVTIAAPGTDARSQQIQAVLARNIYRAWFAHPKTMGVTWWNTVDGGGVWGEPLVSGLFTRDLKKKPVYRALDGLVNGEWKTKTSVKAADGKAAWRGFKGRYVLRWQDVSGVRWERHVTLCDAGARPDGPAFRSLGEKPRPSPVRAAETFDVLRAKTGAVPYASAAWRAEGERAWRPVAISASGIVDLAAATGWPVKKGVDGKRRAEVRVVWTSPVARRARMWFVNDYYGSLRVNGKSVIDSQTGAAVGWRAVDLDLAAGENEIVLVSRAGSGGTWHCGFAHAP